MDTVELYLPFEGEIKFIEVDKEDLVDGKLQKTGERYVLPVEFWNQPAELTMENLTSNDVNPVSVRKFRCTGELNVGDTFYCVIDGSSHYVESEFHLDRLLQYNPRIFYKIIEEVND